MTGSRKEGRLWSRDRRYVGFNPLEARLGTTQKANTSPKRKMSEMISEMAAGFLGVGNTIGERQNRLNAACTAWNMACVSPEVRQRQLEQYTEGYLRFNPGI